MAGNLTRPKLKTLTVAELIELLEEQDPNARVIFSTDYGDYHRTPQALPLSGEAREVTIEKSAYSNSGFSLVRDEDDLEEVADDSSYLLIS